MTINEVRELSTTLLIGLGMFVIGVYLVYVMFGAFNMSRKKETDAKAINEYLLRHLVVYPLVVLAVAAFIAFIIYLTALLQANWFSHVDATSDAAMLVAIAPMMVAIVAGFSILFGLLFANFKADSILTSKLRSEAGEQ